MTDFQFRDYSAPSGNNISFNLRVPVGAATRAALTDFCFGTGIRGDRVNFVFSDGADISGIIRPDNINIAHNLLASGYGFTLQPDNLEQGHNIESIELEQERWVTSALLAAGHEIDQQTVTPLPDYVRPMGTSAGVGLGFARTTGTDKRGQAGWDHAAATDKRIKADFVRAVPCARPKSMLWNAHKKQDRKKQAPWETLQAEQAEKAAGYLAPEPKDEILNAPWDFLTASDIFNRAGYLAPPAKDEILIAPWEVCNGQFSPDFVAPFIFPPSCDHPHSTFWGDAIWERICHRRYYPPAGNQIVFDIEQSLMDVGTGLHTNFYFESLSYDERCTQDEPHGWRDKWPPVPPIEINSVPVRRVYFVLNQVLCCRLPDRTPFEAFNVNISIDLESWAWSISATVDAAAIALLGVTTSPPQIEININGWIWNALVTGWSESRSFPGGSYNITGISRSAELSKTYHPVRSMVEGAVKTAEQLAAAELGTTGWTLDWDLPTWTVPSGVWSYSNLAPMDAISRIAASAGGRVQTHRSGDILQIMPRYPVSPWNWATTTPDLTMTEDAILSMSRQWQPGPCYNGVYVRGVSQGVQALVKRTGTAGEIQATLESDSLITATNAASERGRMILAENGNWSKYSISLPLMASPDEPGLQLPGSLLQITTWKGQVSGTKITAQRKSGGGISVRQNLEIERWHE